MELAGWQGSPYKFCQLSFQCVSPHGSSSVDPSFCCAHEQVWGESLTYTGVKWIRPLLLFLFLTEENLPHFQRQTEEETSGLKAN